MGEQECSCECGSTRFSIQGKPIVRAFCHCTICQAFNDAAYSDVTLFLSKDVHLHDEEKVSFKKYKSPPAVERGKCVSCNRPVIERLELPLLPSLTILPSNTIPKGAFLPEPSMHIFYHRRVAGIEDDVPKYSGFIRSQIALSGKLCSGLLRRIVNS